MNICNLISNISYFCLVCRDLIYLLVNIFELFCQRVYYMYTHNNHLHVTIYNKNSISSTLPPQRYDNPSYLYDRRSHPMLTLLWWHRFKGMICGLSTPILIFATTKYNLPLSIKLMFIIKDRTYGWDCS